MKAGVIALTVVALSWSLPAGGQPAPMVRPDAQTHLDRGLRFYRAKSFKAAAREFEATYKLDPNRDVLYVWAQALRLGGDCAGAVTQYERFLAAGPPKRESELARMNMARCQPGTVTPNAGEPGPAPASPSEAGTSGSATSAPQATSISNPTPPVGIATPAAPGPPTVSLEPVPPVPPRRFSPRATLVSRILLGGGVVAAAAGGAFYLSARSERDAGQRAATYADLEQHAATAHSRDRMAWGAWAVGSTLIVVAIVQYTLR
ncbi:MAG TPA: hypothetical protein VFH73_12435 [Polyangia bacterium]|nr:hypothetical protein [Polyangia bacterium]